MSKKTKIDTSKIDLAKPVTEKPVEYVVAKGKSVTGIRGQLDAGEPVSAREFKNGQKTLDFYIEQKAVVEK
jgi:hypothetical protein